RAHAVCFFFVRLAVVAIHYLTTFILGNDRKAVRLVAQGDVTNLFHQRCVCSRATVSGIEYHHFHSVRKRTSTTGPVLRRRSQKMFARLLAKTCDFIEAED